MTRDEIVRAIRARGVPRGDPFAVRCDTVDCVPKRDVLELLLGALRAAPFHWEDASGRSSRRARMPAAAWRVGRDLVAWPVLVSAARRRARALAASASAPPRLRATDRALYLRTDHWFNVTSGGSVGHVRGVVDALRDVGVDTHVLSSDRLAGVPDDARFHLCRPRYATGRNVPELPELRYNAEVEECAARMWPALRPDFVYQRYSLGNFAGVALRARFGVPLVSEYNGSFPWMARQWDGRRLLHEHLLTEIELLNLHAADLVVVVSEPMRDELRARGVEAPKVLVNPNGVDPRAYAPTVCGRPVRERLALGDRLVFGFIGTFGQWHGAEVLVDAYARLLAGDASRRETTRLLLVGDGPMMPRVREAIARGGVAEACVLTGRVPQADGPAHLAACDVLVSPHVPNPDGTPFFGSPTKLFEYMAMGKAIVASDLDQIGEVLAHARTAWLVPPGDAAALAAALAEIADDAARREALGSAARAEVVAQFTWEAHTRRILEALRARAG